MTNIVKLKIEGYTYYIEEYDLSEIDLDDWLMEIIMKSEVILQEDKVVKIKGNLEAFMDWHYKMERDF